MSTAITAAGTYPAGEYHLAANIAVTINTAGSYIGAITFTGDAKLTGTGFAVTNNGGGGPTGAPYLSVGIKSDHKLELVDCTVSGFRIGVKCDGNDCVLTDCNLSNNLYMGVWMQGDNFLIQGGEISNLGGIEDENYSIGVQIGTSNRGVVRGVTFKNLYVQAAYTGSSVGEGLPVNFSSSASNCVMEFCHCENDTVEHSTLGAFGGSDGSHTFRYNTFINYKNPIACWGTYPMQIFGNTMRIASPISGNIGIDGNHGLAKDNVIIGYTTPIIGTIKKRNNKIYNESGVLMSGLNIVSDSNATPAYVTGANPALAWPSLVAEGLGYDTLQNSSVSGYYVASLAADYEAKIGAYSPTALIINLGTNDLAKATEDGLNNDTVIAGVVASLDSVITSAKTDGIENILLVSPIPSLDIGLNLRLYDLEAAYQKLAIRRGVAFFNMGEAFRTPAKYAENDAITDYFLGGLDKYHLNDAGHAAFSEALLSGVFGVAGESGGGSTPPSSDFASLDATQSGTNLIYSGGNLTIQQSGSSTDGGTAIGTVAKSSGKYYFEVTYATAQALTGALIGVTTGAHNNVVNLGTAGADDWVYDSSGRLNTNGSPAEVTGETVWDTTGNTVGCALDTATGKIWFKDKNGAWLTAANDSAVESGTSPDFTAGSGTFKPIAGIMSGAHNSNLLTVNFGQSAFVHTVPTGFTGWPA